MLLSRAIFLHVVRKGVVEKAVAELAWLFCKLAEGIVWVVQSAFPKRIFGGKSEKIASFIKAIFRDFFREKRGEDGDKSAFTIPSVLLRARVANECAL